MWTPLAPLNRRITADHLVSFSLFWLLENDLIPLSFLEKVSCLASSSTIPYQPLFSYLMLFSDWLFAASCLLLPQGLLLSVTGLMPDTWMKDGDWFMHLGQFWQSGPFGEKVWILSSDEKTPDSADSEWTAEGKWALDSGAVIESSSFSFKESLQSESSLFLSKDTDSRHGSPRKNLTWSSN